MSVDTKDINRTRGARMKRKRKGSEYLDSLQTVLEERVYQDKKFGIQNHSSLKWIAIIVEELGEAAQAALSVGSGTSEGSSGCEDYFLEMVQVCASALAALESYQRQQLTIASSPAPPQPDAFKEWAEAQPWWQDCGDFNRACVRDGWRAAIQSTKSHEKTNPMD